MVDRVAPLGDHARDFIDRPRDDRARHAQAVADGIYNSRTRAIPADVLGPRRTGSDSVRSPGVGVVGAPSVTPAMVVSFLPARRVTVLGFPFELRSFLLAYSLGSSVRPHES